MIEVDSLRDVVNRQAEYRGPFCRRTDERDEFILLGVPVSFVATEEDMKVMFFGIGDVGSGFGFEVFPHDVYATFEGFVVSLDV